MILRKLINHMLFRGNDLGLIRYIDGKFYAEDGTELKDFTFSLTTEDNSLVGDWMDDSETGIHIYHIVKR